jgi:hypothetical protein
MASDRNAATKFECGDVMSDLDVAERENPPTGYMFWE